MATTMNFLDWIDNLQDDDIESIYCLYESVRTTSQMGSFTTTESKGNKFVKTSDGGETLRIINERAETAFLNILDFKYGGDFGWVGGHYEFARSMAKDD